MTVPPIPHARPTTPVAAPSIEHGHTIAPENIGKFRALIRDGALAGIGATIGIAKWLPLPAPAAIIMGVGFAAGFGILGGIAGAALLDY